MIFLWKTTFVSVSMYKGICSQTTRLNLTKYAHLNEITGLLITCTTRVMIFEMHRKLQHNQKCSLVVVNLVLILGHLVLI